MIEQDETRPHTESLATVAPSSVPEIDLRVQLAAERTMLAWLRTGLSLMAFGFVVARFALVLQSMGVQSHRMSIIAATVIGVLLVALGVLVNVGAPIHYGKYFRRIGRSDAGQFTAWPLTVFVSYSMALIGIAVGVYVIIVNAQHW